MYSSEAIFWNLMPILRDSMIIDSGMLVAVAFNAVKSSFWRSEVRI